MRWYYTVGLLLGALLCSSTGHAQTVVAYNTVAFGNGGRGINNPTVTVCAHVQPPANPCTGTLITLYSNSALSALTNPFLGDTFGNVNFWSAPGTYDISIAAPLLPTYTYSVTLGGGTGSIVSVNLLAQTANIGFTTLYAIPSSGVGMYRVSCFTVITTAAGTSSTLPTCQVNWTDADSSVGSNWVVATNSSANTVGTNGLTSVADGSITFNAKAGTNIQYTTVGYASNPASTMQYAVHLRLEYLGP